MRFEPFGHNDLGEPLYLFRDPQTDEEWILLESEIETEIAQRQLTHDARTLNDQGKSNRQIQSDRRLEILLRLVDGSAEVRELAEGYGVTPTTIWRDLEVLSASGLILEGRIERQGTTYDRTI